MMVGGAWMYGLETIDWPAGEMCASSGSSISTSISEKSILGYP